MAETTIEIALAGGQPLTAIETAFDEARWVVVYAPGAGSNVHDPFGAYLCRQLAEAQIASLRFQFPYMEKKQRRPDRPPGLEAAWRVAIDLARPKAARLCVGGRSFGGRIASQVVAQGTAVDALALFAYPLHPPGKPDQLRDQHLASIAAPALFCSGTRDAFATPEELAQAAAKVPRSQVHLLQDADHGFAALKSSGRTRADVWAEAVAALTSWLTTIA